MLKIHSLETFGTHDGPGIRLVVFLQGCNFRCAYCHNPDTIDLKGGKSISVKEIMNILEDNAPYFTNGGGLTVSGGEPLLQAEELILLFKEAKNRGFNTVIDTNGSIDTKEARKALDWADLVIVDLKHFDGEQHNNLTGQGNGKVLKNIEYLEESGKPFWIRYVLVPGWTDQKESLEKMAEWLKRFKFLERVEILPYHNLGEYKYKEMGKEYRLKNVRGPEESVILQTEKILKNQNAPVFIRR
jgi:pyruvate formate lyase activating enzyme